MKMSGKENKEITRQVFEEFNVIKGDISRLNTWFDKSFTADVTMHNAGAGDMNFEQAKQLYTEIISAFSPVCTIKQLIAEDDTVVTRYSWSGTHQGMYKGIPATGKQVEVQQVTITKLRGEKAVEEWAYVDMLGLMRQLGVIPDPAPAK
jgi:predicted ester cyclase